MQDDWKKAETVVTEEMIHFSCPNHHSLTNRALIRARLQDWRGALDDAQQVHSCCVFQLLVFTLIRVKSLKVQLSVIGYIAKAIAHVGQGEFQAGIRTFDLAFMHCSPEESAFLLLIRVRVLVLYVPCHSFVHFI